MIIKNIKIENIISAQNPCRYAYHPDIKTLIMLQTDNEDFFITESKISAAMKGKAKILVEGKIEDFCFEFRAYDHSTGQYDPKIAFKNFCETV